MSKSNTLMFYFGSCGEFPLINDTPWWMVLLVMFWCFTMIPLPNTMDIFVAVCIFLLAVLVAYGAYRLYDLPVREWLKKKLFRTTKE